MNFLEMDSCKITLSSELFGTAKMTSIQKEKIIIIFQKLFLHSKKFRETKQKLHSIKKLPTEVFSSSLEESVRS